jgi:hypothetical protein
MRIPHDDHSTYWCRPKIAYVDPVGVVVQHRQLDYGDVDDKFLITYTDDGGMGFDMDKPWIHVYPEDPE